MENQTTPKLPNVGLASQSIRRSGPVQFIREVITELKKVNWPSRQETIKLTAIVVVISVGVGVFIGGLDYMFISITSVLFKR